MDDQAAGRHSLMLSRPILVCCFTLTSGIFELRRSTGGWLERMTYLLARTLYETWIASCSSRSKPDSGGTMGVSAGPPGSTTFTVTPLPSNSLACPDDMASSAALHGP